MYQGYTGGIQIGVYADDTYNASVHDHPEWMKPLPSPDDGQMLFAIVRLDGGSGGPFELELPTHTLSLLDAEEVGAAAAQEPAAEGSVGGGVRAEHELKYYPLWRGLPNGGACSVCGERRTTKYCAVCFLCERCGRMAHGCATD
jgi:hypothetical protein